MPRLIDAEELIEVAHRARLDSRERIEEMIESAPTVDAEPMRYGHWIAAGFFTAKCSVCDAEVHELEYGNYCPNCGAKMEIE